MAEFVQKEARIACNPITSSFLLSSSSLDDKLPKRAKTFSTSAQTKDHKLKTLESPPGFKPRLPCLVCKEEQHGIAKCPAFASKSMGDKRSFIHQNHLCFGCLRKGHFTKDCRMRHICGICGQRHPTCLHEKRERRFKEVVNRVSTPSEGKTGQEVHRILSHVLVRNATATSSIVPVFLSSVNEPQKKILTYALLDMRSDSSFVLEDLVRELNVNT